MRIVDDYLIGREDPTTGELDGTGLLSGLGFVVYDGKAGIDPYDDTKRIITYPLPFATYFSSVGDDDNLRLSGRKARRSVFFSLTYVGETRRQAKWAGEKLRARLERHRPVIDGTRCWPIHLLLGGSQRVRRDDAVMRPDGSPLFYGIDDYAVSLSLTVTIPEGATP